MALVRHTPLRSTTPLQRGTALAHEGRRGRRLRSGDAKARASAKEHACICGCGATGKAVDWAHLDGRSEDSRQAAHLSVAACRMVHTWLDATAEGVQARRILRLMAQEKGERLTADECRAVLIGFGYAVWLAKARGA